MQKRLFRSRKDRKIAGVARGLANYLEVDVVLIRALFLVAFIVGTTGFWLYIILWAITPEEYQIF
jgi:phage shock protein PspC (stress-responsive transcriptional regulator)